MYWPKHTQKNCFLSVGLQLSSATNEYRLSVYRYKKILLSSLQNVKKYQALSDDMAFLGKSRSCPSLHSPVAGRSSALGHPLHSRGRALASFSGATCCRAGHHEGQNIVLYTTPHYHRAILVRDDHLKKAHRSTVRWRAGQWVGSLQGVR